MMRRAEKLLENTSEVQKKEKVADIRFPEPAPCGRTPIMAKDISKAYGSNIVFAGVNLAIDKGSRVVILAITARARPPRCVCSPIWRIPTPDPWNMDMAAKSAISHRNTTHWTLTPPCCRI